MMDLQNNQKIVNNDNCKFLPITTLKINGLNLSVKRYRMADGLKKKKRQKKAQPYAAYKRLTWTLRQADWE